MKPPSGRLSLLITLLLLTQAPRAAAQSLEASGLERALGDMYGICLFEGEGGANPFGQAVQLARQSLAPGLSSFIESNLAAIPLTPPSLDAEYANDEIVTVVTGFSPVFTESSATVGQGQFLAGTNASYFNLTRIRGQDLRDIEFAFEQDGGGDLVFVTMPLSIEALVFTLYGTYGLTDRLDVGLALPFVRLNIENGGTTFRVDGDNSGCRYDGGGLGPNCNLLQPRGNRDINVVLNNFAGLGTSETYLGTVALRAKYRFPTSSANGRLAAVLDVRVPVGRSADQMLGSGHFGTRLTFIGEYDRLDSFKPYLNVGAQFWNGADSNSLKMAAGFTQRVTSRLFFAFDLLGEFDLESDPFLQPIDNTLASDASSPAFALAGSTIPAYEHDNTLQAGLGLQVALSPYFHVYGSALFGLLDRGLQAAVAPTAGAALYF